MFGMIQKKQKKANVTVLLVTINVAVFFLLSVKGMTEDANFMLEHGAMYVPVMTDKSEYYRLITSMFLHFGFEHLMNNMVILLFVGWNVELEIGMLRFFMIYFASGLCGNVLSGIWETHLGEFSVSAGASGAVFGVIGALLYMLLKNRGHVGNISGRGVLISVALSLYYGFVNTDVDNAAHIGGLVAGFLLGVLLYRKRQCKSASAIEF